MISSSLEIWLYSLMIIGIFSFFIKENPLYHFAENAFVSTSMGIAAAMAVTNIQKIGVDVILSGAVLIVIPFILGILVFTRLSNRYAWLSRYPTAIVMSVGTGLMLRTVLESGVIMQLQNTIQPLSLTDPLQTFNVILGVAIVASVIWYFVFTRPPKYKAETYVRVGARHIIMLVFCVFIASDIFNRVSAMYTVMDALLRTWLGIGM